MHASYTLQSNSVFGCHSQEDRFKERLKARVYVFETTQYSQVSHIFDLRSSDLWAVRLS